MAKKKAAAKKGTKHAAKKSAAKPAAPTKISSGKGATPAELGAKLVELFNQGKADAWIQDQWAKDVVSIEGSGEVHKGKKAILGKWEWWMGQNEVLGGTAEGPFVGGTGFAVKFRIRVRDRASGKEMDMAEVAVYTVKNGKIVQEEFMYGGM